jgi:hypothetical protein
VKNIFFVWRKVENKYSDPTKFARPPFQNQMVAPLWIYIRLSMILRQTFYIPLKWLFIFYYSSVESRVRSDNCFLFSWEQRQNCYFPALGDQNIYLQKLSVYRSWHVILYTTLWDKDCQWLAVARWFSLVSSKHKQLSGLTQDSTLL